MQSHNLCKGKQIARCFFVVMMHRCLFILLGVCLVSVSFICMRGQARAAAYAVSDEINYANSHWNWDWTDLNSTANHIVVGEYVGQPNFQCAEFVARALTAAGWMPGLDANNSSSNQYNGYDGYQLRLVGDLYSYIVDNGYGAVVPLSQASPGDVAFYSDGSGMYHVTLVVSGNGSNALIDGHNVAEYYETVLPVSGSSVTIVHMNSISSVKSGNCQYNEVSCDGRDPWTTIGPNGRTCGSDEVAWEITNISGGQILLYGSANCGTNWAELIQSNNQNYIANANVTRSVYSLNYGGTAYQPIVHSPMVFSPSASAMACGSVNNRPGGCTPWF